MDNFGRLLFKQSCRYSVISGSCLHTVIPRLRDKPRLLNQKRFFSIMFVYVRNVPLPKMSCASLLDGNCKPKSISRARQWTDEIENLYRFQQAGYRDEKEYRQVKQVELVNRIYVTVYCSTARLL